MSITKFREHNNSLLPSWYKWQLHLLFNLCAFLFFLTLGFVRIDYFNLLLPLKILIGLLCWSVLEYAIHRFVLHGSLFSSLPFQKEHSVYHHGYFTDKFMLMKNMNDLNRVFLRPIDIFSILCLNLLFCALMALVIGEQWATYFYISGILYLFLYEAMHMMTHFYDGKNGLLNSIQHHHNLHHRKSLMGKYNFAVVFPFLDKIFKSYQEQKLLEEHS